MSLSQVIHLIVLAGLVAGMIGLFMVGYNLLTSVLVRSMFSVPGETVSGPSRLTRFPRLRLFVGGLVAAVVSGSVVTPAISMISSADGGRQQPGRGPTGADPSGGISETAPWVLLGANLGGALVCWVPALLLFHGNTFTAGLLLLAVAMVLRLYPTIHSMNRADLVTGAALLLIAADLLTGRAPLAQFMSFPGALNGTLAGTLMGPLTGTLEAAGTAGPHIAVAVATGLVLGLALAALTRSTVAVVVVVTALTVSGYLPPVTALLAVAAGNAAPGIAGYYASRPLGGSARSIAGQTVVVEGLAILTGTLLTLLLFLIFSPGAPWAPGVSAASSAVSSPAARSGAVRPLPQGFPPVMTALLLAGFHTAVHLAVIPLFAAVHTPMARLFRTMSVRSRRDRAPAEREGLAFIPPGFPESLDANLVLTRLALARMADTTYEMLMIVINSTQVDDDFEEATDRVIDLRGQVKEMEEQIMQPLSRSIQLPCSPAQADRIQQHQRIARELSLVGDDCFKTIRLLARSYRKNLRFHEESRDELFDYTSRILDFLRYNADYLEGKIDHPDWEIANSMEETIDRLRDKLKKRSRKVLEKSDDVDIRGELTFLDIVSHLEHVGDRCLNIAETVRHLSRS
jgi:phosphate:Na+ symporter